MAIADVLSNDCVYLPISVLFVAKGPVSGTLEVYKTADCRVKLVLQKGA